MEVGSADDVPRLYPGSAECTQIMEAGSADVDGGWYHIRLHGSRLVQLMYPDYRGWFS